MEGPSLHILEEQLKPLVNQKIKDIYGNSKFDKKPLINQAIKDVFAYGKRLIIQLEDHALVIHFLMYGSFRINTQRPEFIPRLAIETKKISFYVYNCSVKNVRTENIKKYLDLDLDILAPNWNVNKIIKLIKLHPNSSIDDILLDQNIFPGVGNIIKNESLYLSKMLPTRKISELNNKKLKEIAINTRLFSEKFYELRKEFQLKKNLKIYRKKNCPICDTKVIRQKTGLRNRWSFFCPHCQS